MLFWGACGCFLKTWIAQRRLKRRHMRFLHTVEMKRCAPRLSTGSATDLDGQMAYFALHEGRVRSALLAAEQSLAQKGRLCVALGLFVGVSAALILL